METQNVCIEVMGIERFTVCVRVAFSTSTAITAKDTALPHITVYSPYKGQSRAISHRPLNTEG